LKEHEWNLYDFQFRYITRYNEFTKAQQQKIIHKIQEPLKNTIMSTYEALILEGEKKKTKEYVLKMHELGLDIDTIIKITSLSKKEIKKKYC